MIAVPKGRNSCIQIRYMVDGGQCQHVLQQCLYGGVIGICTVCHMGKLSHEEERQAVFCHTAENLGGVPGEHLLIHHQQCPIAGAVRAENAVPHHCGIQLQVRIGNDIIAVAVVHKAGVAPAVGTRPLEDRQIYFCGAAL